MSKVAKRRFRPADKLCSKCKENFAVPRRDLCQPCLDEFGSEHPEVDLDQVSYGVEGFEYDDPIVEAPVEANDRSVAMKSQISHDDELKEDEVLEDDERFAGEDEDDDFTESPLQKLERKRLRERLRANQSTG